MKYHACLKRSNKYVILSRWLIGVYNIYIFPIYLFGAILRLNNQLFK